MLAKQKETKNAPIEEIRLDCGLVEGKFVDTRVFLAELHAVYDHPNNLQIESDVFCCHCRCDGVSTVGGGVRKAGFKGGGGVGFLFQVFER